MLKGRMVVKLYFSADWCPPCQVFTHLLKQLHASKRAHCNITMRNILPFEVVLVSQCTNAKANEHHFAAMPWTATTHAEALGERGLNLRGKLSSRPPRP
jgi:thiol-disulfide isomerase/thioredoxin